MNEKEEKRISKFMSLVLRHDPGYIGIVLDASGWIEVETLLAAMAKKGQAVSREQLQWVVDHSDKQRFAVSEDGLRIRANQGHSLEVELGYQAAEPPEFLYHGTPSQFVDAIRLEGLKKMQRHHVHLHLERETCIAVGSRCGKPVLLVIRTKEMHDSGHQFFVLRIMYG